MKKLILIFLVLATSITFRSLGSDTLYYRFSNIYIKDASPNDTLIFDLELRTNTSGTYLSGFQTDIIFNNTVFGNNALPVAVIPLNLFTSAFMVPAGPTSTGTTSFRYANSPFPPYDPSTLMVVPTSSWGKLIRYKMLVLNNSQNLGMQLNVSAMVNNQKWVQSITASPNAYSPIVASNNLLNVPSTPTAFSLMLSELGDPSNSNADFVEIYNPGATSADFSLYSWFLTVYNGSVYQSVQLTGSSIATDAFVVGGNAYAAAYPGKSSDQVSGLIEQNGTVSWYLSFYGPYPSGILVDKYDGSSIPFNGKHAVRKYPVTSPNTTFTSTEWSVTPAVNMDMTPGSHRVTLNWDGSTDIDWFDTVNWTPSFVPDAGHNAQVPASIVPPPTVSTGSSANVHNVMNGTTGSK